MLLLFGHQKEQAAHPHSCSGGDGGAYMPADLFAVNHLVDVRERNVPLSFVPSENERRATRCIQSALLLFGDRGNCAPEIHGLPAFYGSGQWACGYQAASDDHAQSSFHGDRLPNLFESQMAFAVAKRGTATNGPTGARQLWSQSPW